MHQHFGSSFLTDSLNKHGLCVPYSKVLKYERCAAVHQGTKIPGSASSAETNTFHAPCRKFQSQSQDFEWS